MFQSSTYQSIISSMWTPPSKGSVLEWGMFLAQALHLVQICQRSVIQNVTMFMYTLSEWEHLGWSFWTGSTLWKNDISLRKGGKKWTYWWEVVVLVVVREVVARKPLEKMTKTRQKSYISCQPARVCSWLSRAILCQQVFLPRKSTRQSAVEGTLVGKWLKI